MHVALAFPVGGVYAARERWLVGAGYFLGFATLPLVIAIGQRAA